MHFDAFAGASSDILSLWDLSCQDYVTNGSLLFNVAVSILLLFIFVTWWFMSHCIEQSKQVN